MYLNKTIIILFLKMLMGKDVLLTQELVVLFSRKC